MPKPKKQENMEKACERLITDPTYRKQINAEYNANQNVPPKSLVADFDLTPDQSAALKVIGKLIGDVPAHSEVFCCSCCL